LKAEADSKAKIQSEKDAQAKAVAAAKATADAKSTGYQSTATATCGRLLGFCRMIERVCFRSPEGLFGAVWHISNAGPATALRTNGLF